LIFQPHLYSRTQDQAAGFIEVMDKADEVILLPIYPARELPIEGITSSWLLDKMTNNHKKVVSKSDLIAEIMKSEAKIIVTIGAGDIGELVQPIKEALLKK
jgi:UDP-N-acetylmuramate--alanine ligase